MVKKVSKSSSDMDKKTPFFSFLKTRQAQTVIATFLILFASFLAIAFVSFFFNWQEDQSTLHQLTNRAVKSSNLLGKIGANLSHFFIYRGFGIAAFIIAFQLFLTGVYILFQRKLSKMIISWNWGLVAMVLVSVMLGFLHEKFALLSGVIGFEINGYLQDFIGKTGLSIFLTFFFTLILSFAILFYPLLFPNCSDRTFSCSCIVFCILPSNWQTSAMPYAPIATKIH